ncbi:MAG TPA: zf-HC2 domain-containing protein [Acidobacteriota bacterium]|nr:zf-HC2 domain-containing protein [Acidobacteriota bacterium]
MDCSKVELWLSEYMEASLPAEAADAVAKHLVSCRNCSALLQEMRSIVSLCHDYPSLEMGPEFVERILLRTSGRPRTRSFRELLHQHIIRPLLTPRLAIGATLATLFLFLMLDLMLPRLSVTFSSISPAGVVRLMDRGARQLYGEGLRAYNKKNEWQEQYNRFKNNTLNNLRSIMEQIDVPVEGHQKTEEPEPPKDDAPKEKSSGLFLWPA